jgi:hypothetical protein
MIDPPLTPWSDTARRAYLPALIAACYAGDRGRIIDLCESEDLVVAHVAHVAPAAPVAPVAPG